MKSPPLPPAERPSGSDRWLLLAGAVAGLVPWIAYHGLLNRLFWYADEFDQMDQIDHLGFWHWVVLAFGENFAPVFKVLWGGSVFLFHGSYAAMIAILWLTHALNVALLGRVMRTCGLTWLAVGVAQVAFGLTAANYETLAWSIQWSAILSMTFLLLAIEGFLQRPPGAAALAWTAASALSFSRGVLTGGVLALGSLWPQPGKNGPALRVRCFRACCYLAPAAAVALAIALFSSGNHNHMKGHWAAAAQYAAWYYCLNPAHLLFSIGSMATSTVALMGLCKIACVAGALIASRGRQRLLFALLLAFDLGNAFLLGIGRYHTGLPTTVSSRYQYASLVALAPIAGFWIERLWALLPAPRSLRAALAAGALGALAVIMIRQWPRQLDSFTDWRGTQSRRVLLIEPNPPPHSVPGIPWMEMDRAKFLIAKYTLH